MMQWIHHYGVTNFDAMTNLSKALRTRLQGNRRGPSTRGRARPAGRGRYAQVVAATGRRQLHETVFIPEAERGTLCVSSQVGCTLNCAFCATGHQGFNRNLDAHEIIGQVWAANRALGRDPKGERIITNVVMMGMGEPLLNFDNVVMAMKIMLDDMAYGLSGGA